ncbi:MAG: hypothetical protein EOO52_08325 [Gammaproteobacteria bacterium]|nr:MAG: hypothetical protein EOO52_08325 [Gammaproteobacteria bacterium]
MVILIATRKGYEEMKPVIYSGLYPVWLGAEILSQEEKDAVRALGINLTDFNYSINIQDFSEIECAVETIREHHPNHKIWVEWEPKI